MSRTPTVLFLGSGFAGNQTRFTNLRQHVEGDARLRPEFREVTGWKEGGVFERLPFPSKALRGRLRTVVESAPIARIPRPDAIWAAQIETLAPFMWSQVGPWRRPLVLDLDRTDRQIEEMASDYYGRPAKRGLGLTAARVRQRVLFSKVDLFLPWSAWAGEGLRSEGVPAERIRVLPPGIDLAGWQPVRRDTGERPLRLLFVGGDFDRKGGNLLLEAVRRAPGSFELTLVTRDLTGELPPGAHVVRASPNSPELRAAYAWADVFVLPTRAECFGIATVEAMATGLPTIVGDVGGARDIVEDGVTGWLIEPTAGGLATALSAALAARESLPGLGARGRIRAERYFDGARNDRAVVDLVLELAERRHGAQPAKRALEGTTAQDDAVRR